MTICFLGRQADLSIAELEALHGAGAVQVISNAAALVDGQVTIARLGGTMKTAHVLSTVDMAGLPQLVNYCKKMLPEWIADLPEGKIKFGLSFYNLEKNSRSINAASLELKKVLRDLGRSVRVVPNQEPALSNAQTLHNQIISPLGMELVFVRHGEKTIIGRVNGIQDLNSYTRRDRERPKRDARVGMLPPKLAQIIINLAHTPTFDKQQAVNDHARAVLLDPFCGTGVILQEALLMGYEVYGTDLEPRMIDYSRANLNWLHEQYNTSEDFQLDAGDATNFLWSPAPDLVACETYLGRPFTEKPTPQVLGETVGDCNLIITKFLRNIHPQLAPGARLCVAVPAWQITPGNFKQLPLIDALGDLGYNRVSFEHVLDEKLLYYREDQIVARKLLVLTRK